MKRILTLILCASMLINMLAGCSGKKNEEQAPVVENSTPAVNSINADWPAIGTAEAPVPVKFLLKEVFPDEPDIILLLDTIEKKMAEVGQFIDLELLEPPATDYGTALPLAIRSGELQSDLILFQGGDVPIAQEGLLEDLTPYIEKSKYVKDIMEPANVERVKNYPYLLWLAPARCYTPVMRSDWTKQLTSYPTMIADPTVDNYYAMLKEMKEKNLTTYALSGDGSTARFDSIFNHAFGVTSTLSKQNDKWVFSNVTENEKNKLEFYAKLYKDGLIDPEYLTNKWDALEQKFYDGRVGITSGTAGAVVKIYDDKMVSTQGADATLLVLPPAKGISQAYPSIDVTKESRGMAISTESKNKDAAWAFLEFMASPEGRKIDKIGVEGVHYKVEGDKIVFTEKFDEWWSRIWETTYKFDPTPALEKPVYGAAAQSSLDYASKYYMADTNIVIPDELAPQYDAMKALYNEYSTEIIRGTKPISAFEEFVQKWNAAGGDAFSEYLATAMA